MMRLIQIALIKIQKSKYDFIEATPASRLTQSGSDPERPRAHRIFESHW